MWRKKQTIEEETSEYKGSFSSAFLLLFPRQKIEKIDKARLRAIGGRKATGLPEERMTELPKSDRKAGLPRGFGFKMGSPVFYFS